MRLNKTTAAVDRVPCPKCSKPIDLTTLHPKNRGTILRCGGCSALLKTCGGLIASIEDSPLQSCSLEEVDSTVGLDLSTVPTAPVRVA